VADINVTPLADVMIVLLIISLVVVPRIGDTGVQLPRAARVAERKDGPPVVTVKKDATTLLDDHLVTRPALLERLRDRLATLPDAERVVRVRADQAASFATVGAVLDACRQAGADSVTLVAEPKAG
jgi:biopolymer transport protein ExbD